MLNIKFTPETLIMLPIAFFLDLCGLAIVVFGLDDLGLLDIIGIFIFFPWLLIRGERLPSLAGTKSGARIKEFLTKLFKNKHLKFLTPLIGEITPWVGGLGFFWTLSVLFNLEEE
ncbi:MAG TPA: hypothetical protein PLI02_02170 [Candidatus Pacearchaeota archaeon]|nr:hypothetical protein [Candidatus Pacearchaeota archaeon]